MKIDPRHLTNVEVSDLLCSTQLGQVTNPRVIAAIQRRAGFAIGDGTRIDLVRLTAWLLKNRPVVKTPEIFDSMPKAGDTTDTRLVKRAIKHGWGKSSRLRQLAEQKLEEVLTTSTVSVRAALAAIDAVLELNKQNIHLEQQDRSDQAQRQGGTEDKSSGPVVTMNVTASDAVEASKNPAVADGFSKLIGAMYRGSRPDQSAGTGGDSAGDAPRGSRDAVDDRQV